MNTFPPFRERVQGVNRSTHERLDVMQLNVGRLCNLTCRHCHMQAGPNRTEVMTKETFGQCLQVACTRGFKTLDVTGGAPEMNAHFKVFMQEARARGLRLIVRSNLVVMHHTPYRELPDEYAKQGVQVVASLPHYTEKPVDKQRGHSAFQQSLSMLQRLNALGYGHAQGSDENALILNLVFNPSGAFLPPNEQVLEKEYRKKLWDDYGIVFDHVFAIANAPLGRFGKLLHQTHNLKPYMTKLVEAFNPATLPNMMCRKQLSVGWDGTLYDCDFNQATSLPCKNKLTIAQLASDPSLPLKRSIAFANHCYSCCAGAGSS